MSSYKPIPVEAGESENAARLHTRQAGTDASFLSRLLVVPDPFAPPVEWHGSRDGADESSDSGMDEDEYYEKTGRSVQARGDVEGLREDEEEEDLGWTEGLLSGTTTKGTKARKASFKPSYFDVPATENVVVRPQRRLLLFALLPVSLIVLALVLFSTLSPAFRISTSSLLRSDGAHTYVGEAGKKVMTLDELRNGTFWTDKVDIEWLAEGERSRS